MNIKKMLLSLFIATTVMISPVVATDLTPVDDFTLGTDQFGIKARIGVENNYIVNSVTAEDDSVLFSEDIIAAMEERTLVTTVIVKEGRINLKNRPDVSIVKVNGEKELRLSIPFIHNYGIETLEAVIQLSFCAKQDIEFGSISLKKGEKISTEDIKFTTGYVKMFSIYKDMELTLEEVKNNEVLLDNIALCDTIGTNKRYSVAFEDIATLVGKTNRRPVTNNLYYSIDEVEPIVNAYPDIDFSFITFNGNSKIHDGTLYFNNTNANTAIYKIDGDWLVALNTEYDPQYKVTILNGVNKLSGTYVIASSPLHQEEAIAEPESKIKQSTSQYITNSIPMLEDDDEGMNPNTGA